MKRRPKRFVPDFLGSYLFGVKLYGVTDTEDERIINGYVTTKSEARRRCRTANKSLAKGVDPAEIRNYLRNVR